MLTNIMTQAIEQILKSHETPFYVFDEKGFIDNYQRLEDLFQSIYPSYHISYSYKTNYTPFICNLVKDLGGYAEVVSDMEYELAKRIGYSYDMIVYNGPSKGPMMFEHLENGGILNIDSFDETQKIVDYCKANPHRTYTCGIRINLNLSADFISRFGMVDESDDLINSIDLISGTPNLSLVGLHCHISRCRGIEAWSKRSEIMLKMADRYISGIPKYISLGSGMFADMPEYLKAQFGGDSVPTYEDYAEAAIRPFYEHYKECDNKPILFTEPGTTLVARYLSFATKVLSIKDVRGRQIANMDGSYHNLGEICTLKQLPVSVINNGAPQRMYPNMDVMGYTCLEQDLMVSKFSKPIAVGDILIFENVGGYSIVEKPQFIKPQCAMYAITSNNEIKLIMRSETFDDIFNKFSFA